ncbi:hypothetical protein [Bizionia arctica]|uniref:Uncharacterized protein n=1 Tax=Bizionia arctica TaxID=1495645 RepID=A0A917GH49_9FLAO|nr:hypothetical protein [Bizionia arctica]GGG45973.1 hypothetical protein GCM10010976_16940 [Bizionia arctica]
MKGHRVLRVFSVLSILLLQIAFLSLTLKEKYESENYVAILSILGICLTMYLAYLYLDFHYEDYVYEKITVAIWVPIGAIICFALNVYTGLGSVLAASITGVLASFIPCLNKKSYYLKDLPPAIYCGTFIGMSSMEISSSWNFVLAAGVLSGIYYILSKNLYIGIGGKLGTIAFGGVISVSLIYWLVQ